MKDGAIAMSDGSPALRSLAKEANIPSGSAVHGKGEYVKQVRFPLKQLSPRTKTVVQKKPARCTTRSYYTLAGGQGAESAFGTAATSRGRMNHHGRRSANNAHVHQLAAMYLVHNPGLESVLAAFKKYRLYAQDNLSPADASGAKAKKPWLNLPDPQPQRPAPMKKPAAASQEGGLKKRPSRR